MFKTFTALFVILKLIEAGARRRQEHGVSRCGMGAGISHGIFESFAVTQRNRALEGLLDQRPGCPDQQSAFGALGEWRAQGRVIAAFVLSAEDDPQAALERIDGL